MSSQYLSRVPVSKAKHRYCYYCDIYMKRCNKTGKQAPHTKTKDHILPRCVGTIPRILNMDRANKRSCCADCNSFREQLGHCAGLLMMMIIEGQRRGIDKKEAAIMFGIIRSKSEHNRLKRERSAQRRHDRLVFAQAEAAFQSL